MPINRNPKPVKDTRQGDEGQTNPPAVPADRKPDGPDVFIQKFTAHPVVDRIMKRLARGS